MNESNLLFEKQRFRGVSIIAGLALVLFSGVPAYGAKTAAPENPPEKGIEESMRVSPTKIESVIGPGHDTSVSMRVFNGTRQNMRVSFSAWDFARDESGAAYPISKKDAAKFSGAASWLDWPKLPLTLKAGEEKSVTINIKAPKNAKPGTHATYLKVLGTPEYEKFQTVNLRYAIDALFLPIVLEKSHGRLPVLKTKVKMAGISAGGRYHVDLPLNVVARVKNEGNIHQNFAGAIEIWQGKTKLKSFPLRQTILPGQTSHLIASVDDIPYGGRFTARFKGAAFLAKTHKQQELLSRTSFWYVPKNMIYFALGAIAIILALTVGVVRSLHRAGKSPIPGGAAENAVAQTEG